MWMGSSKLGLEVNFSKRKYLWLIEYEKFNNFRLCLQQIRSTAINITNSPLRYVYSPIYQNLTNSDIYFIKSIIKNSIQYQDNDIDQAATYIKDELTSSMKNKYWDYVITDPTISYGYFICWSIGRR